MRSDLPADSGRRRRRIALAGLALSGAVAAGAVAGWLSWRAPDTVRLVGTRPAAPVTPSVPTTATRQAEAVAEAGPLRVTPVSPPVRIIIPSEAISAQVVPEGIQPDGSLVIPPPAQVGWYAGGPAPGQAGSTVIAGHIDDYGVPGAFRHLNAVPLDATVTLTTADGRTQLYTITDRMSIPKTDLAGSGLLTRSGPPRLVLITCGGSYHPRTHRYLDNIVLVASPAPAPGNPG